MTDSVRPAGSTLGNIFVNVSEVRVRQIWGYNNNGINWCRSAYLLTHTAPNFSCQLFSFSVKNSAELQKWLTGCLYFGRAFY